MKYIFLILLININLFGSDGSLYNVSFHSTCSSQGINTNKHYLLGSHTRRGATEIDSLEDVYFCSPDSIYYAMYYTNCSPYSDTQKICDLHKYRIFNLCSDPDVWNGSECVDNTCLASQTWDYDTMLCKNKCTSSQTWNSITEQCDDEEVKCKEQEIYDKDLDKCMPICDTPMIYDFTTKECVNSHGCSEVLTNNASYNCKIQNKILGSYECYYNEEHGVIESYECIAKPAEKSPCDIEIENLKNACSGVLNGECSDNGMFITHNTLVCTYPDDDNSTNPDDNNSTNPDDNNLISPDDSNSTNPDGGDGNGNGNGNGENGDEEEDGLIDGSALDGFDGLLNESDSFYEKWKNEFITFTDNVNTQVSDIESQYTNARNLFESDKFFQVPIGNTNNCLSFNFYGKTISFDLCTSFRIFSPIVYFIVTLLFMISTFRFFINHLLKGFE